MFGLAGCLIPFGSCVLRLWLVRWLFVWFGWLVGLLLVLFWLNCLDGVLVFIVVFATCLGFAVLVW